MWEITKENINANQVKIKILQNGKPMTFAGWIEGLKSSLEFVEFFVGILNDCPFEAFFWEVKPITQANLSNGFEFVLVSSQSLVNISANDSAFKRYFNEGNKVVSFPNLGGDAQLVVPTQNSDIANYAHLASFIRNAPKDQLAAFWNKVAIEYEKLIGQSYKWLSTAGLGIYWLHVRIDSSPKYYRFNDYKLTD